MFSSFYIIFFLLCFVVFVNPHSYTSRSGGAERSLHKRYPIHGKELDLVVEQTSDMSHFKRALKNILIPRVVGTTNHKKVQDFITNEFVGLKWDVKFDTFKDRTPIGTLEFKNIVATHNPRAKRFLDIGCHYDSKYFASHPNFVGAIDSAVPCSMMIHIAHSLKDSLSKNKNDNITLRYLFIDGEEAFHSWSSADSLYGARHLAEKMEGTPYSGFQETANELDRVDLFVLLDLLGVRNPQFFSFFPDTLEFYKMMVEAESKLSERGLLKSHDRKYFQKKSTDAYVEDDHLPFLSRGVPILHVIATPFPNVWHTPRDNKNAIDYPTVGNLIKIFSVFITEYLNLKN